MKLTTSSPLSSVLQVLAGVHTLTTLIDSGTDANILSEKVVIQFCLIRTC